MPEGRVEKTKEGIHHSPLCLEGSGDDGILPQDPVAAGALERSCPPGDTTSAGAKPGGRQGAGEPGTLMCASPSSARRGGDPSGTGGPKSHRSQLTGHRAGPTIAVGVRIESDKG